MNCLLKCWDAAHNLQCCRVAIWSHGSSWMVQREKCGCFRTLFMHTTSSFSASLVLGVQWLTTILGCFWTFHTLPEPVKPTAQTDKCVLLQRWQYYIFLYWDEKLPCGTPQVIPENFQLKTLMETNPPLRHTGRSILLISFNCSPCNRASLEMCVSSLKL